MAFNKYHTKVEYSKRPDGRWNKWQEWPAADWYDWDIRDDRQADALCNYTKWVLVDVVDNVHKR